MGIKNKKIYRERNKKDGLDLSVLWSMMDPMFGSCTMEI